MDPAYRALYSFVNRVDDTRSSTFLVDGIDSILYIDVRESLGLIALDNFLARFLHLFFVHRLIDLQGYVLANLFRIDSLSAIDLDLAHNGTRL